MPMYNNMRDEIADFVSGRAFGAGLAGLSGAMPPNMPAQMPAGMPQTPAGGVPGSGLMPFGQSIVPQQPQKLGLLGEMPGMGARGIRRQRMY
jgi:hypothetical protein